MRGLRAAAVGIAGGAMLLLCLAPAAPATAAPAIAARSAAADAGTAAAAVYQTPAQASAQAVRTGKAVPVTGATTPTSTLTADPDGSFTATESAGPTRARVDGTWRSLDANLVRNADGTWSPVVSTDPLRLSGGGTAPLAVMRYGASSLALTAPMRLPAPVISGNTATYPSVLPGVSLIVTAGTSGAFSEVFELANAAAAANPALAKLTFTTSTSGLTLRAAKNGVISAVTRNGQAVISAPAPRMWDSTVTTGRGTALGRNGTRINLATGQPAASTATGPGFGAKTAPLAVGLSGHRITLTAQGGLLGSSKAVYPEFIDPNWVPAPETASSWAYVSAEYPNQQYYDTSSALQVGQDPDTGTTSYAFYTMKLPPANEISGAIINTAEVYFPEIWSYSCTASPVDLYQTGPISSATTYDNLPGWGTDFGSDDVAYGWSPDGTGGPSSCPYTLKDVSYSIVSKIQSYASTTVPAAITLGLKAEDTSNSTGWKQFSDPSFSAIPENASITIKYAHTPTEPGLSTSPASNCAGTTVLGDGNVGLKATASDPDGTQVGSLSVNYAVYADGNTADAFASNSPMSLSQGSGTTADLVLSASDLEKALTKWGSGGQVTVTWTADTSIALGGVPASPTATCSFVYTTKSPGAPTVTDSGGKAGCDNEPYTVGTATTFTAAPADGTVSITEPLSYVYQLNGGSPVSVSSDTQTGYTAPIPVTPTRLTNVLNVTAVGAGGNVGQAFSCVINASAPATPATDQDMSGDGVPDLVTVGGTSTGTAPGLWLADGQASAGRFDGTVNTTAADLAPLGPQDVGTPLSWNRLQAITGEFTDSHFNDIEAYLPGTGDVYILPGLGDGSATTSNEQSLTNILTDTNYTSGAMDDPLQLVNAYDLSADNEPYPDQIGLFTDPSVGSYLAYFANDDSSGVSFDSGDYGLPYELTNTTPDGTMDWADWTITTDSDTRAGTAYTDMWLRNQSTGALYLWELTGLTNEEPAGFDVNPTATLTYSTSTEVSAGWDKGTTLATFQATDVNGNPGLVTVTSASQVQSWQWNGTTLTQAGTTQALHTADPDHTYLLNNGTSGAVGTVTDDPGAGDTEDDLTGHNATWNTGDQLYSPDIDFNGTTSFVSSDLQTGIINTGSPFTISAWVNPAALGGTVFSQNGALYSSIAVSTTTAGKWSIEMNGTNTSISNYKSATGGTAYPGTWVDLTLTYDGTTLTLYVGGTKTVSLTDTTPPTATGRFDIGSAQSDGGGISYLSGQVSDVQTWNTVAVPA
jgi:Concanavalin A-like lectin/glucanases superfamily